MTPLTAEVDVLHRFDGPTPVDPVELADLVEYALRRAGATGAWSVAVVLTSDAHLRQLHRDFMGIDEETDVMTFPHGDGADQSGDIVISVERAAEQGREFGLSAADEIRFLAVHGVLHLRGWKDDTPDRRVEMLSRQSEIIEAFDAKRRPVSG